MTRGYAAGAVLSIGQVLDTLPSCPNSDFNEWIQVAALVALAAAIIFYVVGTAAH
jgi:hypothetical protein